MANVSDYKEISVKVTKNGQVVDTLSNDVIAGLTKYGKKFLKGSYGLVFDITLKRRQEVSTYQNQIKKAVYANEAVLERMFSAYATKEQSAVDALISVIVDSESVTNICGSTVRLTIFE